MVHAPGREQVDERGLSITALQLRRQRTSGLDDVLQIGHHNAVDVERQRRQRRQRPQGCHQDKAPRIPARGVHKFSR